MLRTKGRLYVLVDVEDGSVAVRDVATEAAQVLSVGRLVDVIGADEMKSAVLTLHPTAAAQQLRERFRSNRVGGRAVPGVLVVEVSPLAAAPRVRSPADAKPAEKRRVEDPEVE